MDAEKEDPEESNAKEGAAKEDIAAPKEDDRADRGPEPKEQGSQTGAGTRVVQKGDLTRLELDGWTLDPDGEHLFETTSEERAKEAGMAKEGKKYAPISVVVGAGQEFVGLEKALLGAKVGEEVTIEIPAEEAAGPRTPTNYKFYSIRQFAGEEELQIGGMVMVDNKVGYIAAMTAGRVKVDFNHPLAGKRLRYRFKVLEVHDTMEEKAKGIIERDYGTAEGFEVSKADEGVEIVLPDICKYDTNWSHAKYKIVADLRALLDIPRIKFVEIYVKKLAEAQEGEEQPPAGIAASVPKAS
ncbi:MAG: FKBP-type peptidyl-prolyl cis-trans isomerase [Candidatus Thermoplasmatota archaeon]